MSSSDRKKHSLEGFVTSTVPLALLPNSRNTDDEEPSGASQWYVPSDPHRLKKTQAGESSHEAVQLLHEDVFDPNAAQPLKPRDVEQKQIFKERPLSSDSEVLSMQTVLMQLDKEEENRRRHTLQLDHYTKVMQPVSWEETAEDNCHLWVERDTREACYLNDTQYCQDQKIVHPKRQKVRCSACRILVHTTCMKQLCYEGVFCKSTFREIKQKEKKSSIQHHFLKRRKLSGKCSGNCGRGFGNFKSFSGRVFEGFSCSWCGDSYHLGCFSEKLRDEICHLGPLRNLIIPSSWIIKLPQIEPEPSPDPEKTGAAAFGSSRKKKTSRRRTRRNPSSSDDRASKFFTVKPFVSSNHKPLLVFINPKSGGNQGAKLMQNFQWLLNPRQVFDLTKGGPKFGLTLFKNCSNMRILACGGDGTVGWVLSVLDQLDFKPVPPSVAVLPLGTGNDLARVLNWGGSYGDEPLENVLMHVENGSTVELDRWVISIWRNEDVENYDDFEGKEDIPLHVVNNYLSIGADAQVSLDFHDSREANPQKYNNRFKNKFAYSRLTGQELVLRKFANMTDSIRLIGDGHDFTQHIRQLRLEALCFLNITSYGSGNNPWGAPPPGTFSGRHQIGAQAMDDGLIEIVGFWASTFPKLLMGAHGERIAHCQHIKIYTYTSLPIQIDGEACKLKPSIIEIVHQNKALMVKKEALRTHASPLRGISDNYQLKLSVSKVTYEQYHNLHSDLKEIKKAAVGLGLVITTASQSLRSLRPRIERFTQSSEHSRATLSKNWQYLDVASTGRLDQVFQILPEQEESVLVGNMLSDGILVIDCESLSPVNPDDHVVAEPPPEKPISAQRKDSYTMAVDLSDNELLSEGGTTRNNKEETQSGAPLGSKESLSSTPKSPDTEGYDSDRCLLPEFETGLSPLPKLDSSNSDDESESGQSYASLQKALFDAVKRGNLKKVEEVHHKGARLANVDQHGLSPLHHAARLGRKDVVQYLVSNVPRDSLDLQDEEKAQTALHKAAWYGYRGICKILVDAGASLLRTDYQANTPYLKSIESEDPKLQEYLQRKEREEKIRYEIEEIEEVAV
ncbi:PREDICTED: diacylglycerol kinase zeta-like [Amphimedon queenslandica]|uniref:Diacylglycerol kinase n=1 Tax=Amphimedon queenslandica TaxID=400682 RepID=A0A1X7VG96_AMPQE|nr:PREDICTED: diacylglycerol kinase zeta-like [Amphimedon queenslandica]|eukprot:XP_019848920.1 PREDICTED: diacylglycerol kinase zeta-like [Amphimedon queenslandica]